MGEKHIVKSVCRICHGGCGALITVEDGKVVKVIGNPDSPMSKGWMCVKGASSAEIANHPDRLTDPLKKIPGKTGPTWQKISWQQALAEIAAKLDSFRTETGPESIALGQGTGRHHYMHTVRFANALGTPNWYEPGLANCFIPRITVSNMTYGSFVGGDYYGEVAPKCIMFWGHNPLVSSADGELGIVAKRALDQGAVGIAIDPRRSETAQKSRLWLPIRPGTDAALALAMIQVIIEEDLYDHDFVTNWTVGFAELQEHVRQLTPEWAEKITTVKARDIREAGRIYATHKPAILEWGLGIEQNTNCLQTVRAISFLRALTGNLDVPGGDILGMNILRSYPTLAGQLPKGMIQKRLGAEEYKLLGGFRAFMPSAHIPALFKAMRTGEPYRVRALLVFGGNPLLTVANSREVYDSLKALELLVVTDLFMTPTAEMADYVLPASFWTEVEQIIGYPLVSENMVFAQRQAAQVGNCRQDEWIMNELAKLLKLPGCDDTLADVFNHQLEPTGLTHADLLQSGHYHPPHKYRKYLESGFRTPSRKVEFYSKSLARLGYDPLPSFQEPPESPVSRPDLTAEFPYVLITGSRRREFFHSEQRQIKSLRKLRPDPHADLHPEVACLYGINQDDWMEISSPRGTIRMRAQVTEDINPGVINVEHGWWFPEKDGPEHGLWESNANVLTSNAPPYDPAFGTYQLRGLLCKISKVEQP